MLNTRCSTFESREGCFVSVDEFEPTKNSKTRNKTTESLRIGGRRKDRRRQTKSNILTFRFQDYCGEKADTKLVWRHKRVIPRVVIPLVSLFGHGVS